MRQATPSTHLGQPEAPQAKVFWYKLLGQWFLSELYILERLRSVRSPRAPGFRGICPLYQVRSVPSETVCDAR